MPCLYRTTRVTGRAAMRRSPQGDQEGCKMIPHPLAVSRSIPRETASGPLHQAPGRDMKAAVARSQEADPVAYPLFLAKLLIRSGIARFLPSVQRLLPGGGPFLHYYSDRVLAAPHAELLEAAEFFDLHG